MESVFALPRESDRDGGRREKSKGAAVAATILWGGGGWGQGHFSFRTTQCQRTALSQLRRAAQSSAFTHLGSKHTSGQVCRHASRNHARLKFQKLLSIQRSPLRPVPQTV